MKYSFSRRASTAAILGLFLQLSACGKSVQVGDPAANGSDDPLAPPTLACSEEQKAHWEFVQPDPTANRVLDVLFVVDTSDSLKDKRSKLAANIPAFIAKLAPGTDYRVAVMLGHGGASKYSGKLYSASGVPKVLDSKTLSQSSIQAALKQDLEKSVADADQANGEALIYSLLKSMEPASLATIRGQGFYRTGAALAVVFVTDENDICFPPQSMGYTGFPDYSPSPNGVEEIAAAKYCSSITSVDDVYSELASFQGERPLTLAGITHVDPAKVPSGGEDSIGHGINELVRKSKDGILIDIGESQYSDGLASFGAVVSQSLDLKTRFILERKGQVIPGSLSVSVDRKPVRSSFDPASESVEISLDDAGKSRSVVDVNACLAP